MNKLIGIFIIVLALATAIVPIFTACDTTKMAMKCHWTAQAEIAIAIPLAASGIIITVIRRKEVWRFVSLVGLTLGLSTILIPTVLIGVCNPPMTCNTLMRPLLLVLGALTIISNLGLLCYSLKSREV
jgi:hypothetical protein